VSSACCKLQRDGCFHTPMAGKDPASLKKALGERAKGLLMSIFKSKVGCVVCVLGCLGLGIGLGVQYASPGFVYPSSEELQLLRSDNPLEKYCCSKKQVKFEFHLGSGDDDGGYPIHFVFGTKMVDNGNKWDPSDYPTAEFTGGFDPTSQESQKFLLNLCQKVRNASWYEPSSEKQTQNEAWRSLPVSASSPYGNQSCEIEVMNHWAQQPCGVAPEMGECCGQSGGFPVEPTMFKKCQQGWSYFYSKTVFTRGAPERNYWYPNGDLVYGVQWPARAGYGSGDHLSGNWFDPSSGTPKILSLSFMTNISYSQKYDVGKSFYDTMDAWSETALAGAPAGLSGGYWTTGSRLEYYSLQTAMKSSADTSTIIAIVIALSVLLLMTANVMIALFATLTIVLIMGTVSGIVILLGWEQGIIESIIISCGIGMACDFSAHLGFAYRQANLQGKGGRGQLVEDAIERMVPALTSAAFSTGAMGFLMIFAGTVFTQKFGIFICLLMVFGWFFGVFFLLPLLCLLGPTGKTGEIAPCLFQYPTDETPSSKVVEQKDVNLEA